ncbi:MAG TPA: hypothetical protein VJ180_04580 [Pyrinomonadaceae bacterium]|nr:hypothetical protein [Pyrinomonadaceae bacterium]
MIISLALAFLATVSGTVATYLYEPDASFAERLCSGACLGLAVLGLIGFIFASILGLTPVAIFLTAVVLATSFLLLVDNDRRLALKGDLSALSHVIRRSFYSPDRNRIGYFLFYAATAVLFWRIFDRAVIVTPEGIFTGLLNNFGDLPFHLSVITGFAFGNNFPPQDPTYAGVPFTYPFLTDFISAIFVRCGMNLRQSIFVENFILAMAFVGLIHRWAYVMLRNRLAAVITPLLVLLNGGFGWILFWQQGRLSNDGLFGGFQNLPPSFTIIPDTVWRWGNAITTLLVPQRGMLLGLPLAVMVFTQWWLAMRQKGGHGDAGTRGRGDAEKGGRGDAGTRRPIERSNERFSKTQRKNARHRKHRRVPASRHLRVPSSDLLHIGAWQRMAAAGVIAGFLPLVHAHSFVVVMGVGFFIGLLQRRWRAWAIFVAVASLVALPQMWWSTQHSAVDATKFFEWQFGWDRGKEDAVLFWFKNTGLFIPLIVAAILWRGKHSLISRQLLLFYLPFTLCFIIPNLLKMAPWIWDNIKVLFYWWLASAPLVAMLLARLWRQGLVAKTSAALLLFFVILGGALDVAGIALRSNRYEVFDAYGVSFAEVVKQKTEPQAVIVHAPVHNHPVFLTGRRSLMGYPGHIWTHGLEFTERESEIRRIYSGAPDAAALIDKYKIQYAVIGPHEGNVVSVNEQFFARFTKIGEVGEYRLFKIRP